jgi:DNA topoisomerase-1
MGDESLSILEAPPVDPVVSAAVAGLIYVSDGEPGIRRVIDPEGGMSFISPDGTDVADEAALARIRALAIPPAWTEVWICAEPCGHIQATGRDARGRKQYRYHAGWNQVRSQTKYDRMLAFAEALPRVREQVEADLNRRGLPREKVLATILRLMEMTFIRVGNAEYARQNGSYGLTTLRDKHVRVEGSTIAFQFVGKSGRKHAIDVRDRKLARIVKQCRDIPGYELFQYYDSDGERQRVGSGDVNAYLRELTGQSFSAKDFRTWGGTMLAATRLAALGPAPSLTEARRTVVQVVKEVSETLGNRPATCRKYYVHPAVLEAYQDGSFAERWAAETERVAAGESVAGLSADEAALVGFLRRAATNG